MKRDARRKAQNSGVTLVSLTSSFSSSKDENPKTAAITYYGAVRDIIELDYYGHFNFVLFKCDWFGVEKDKFGLTCVNFSKKCYQNDPFVLPSQVQQCFYVQDPLDANRHYAMKTTPRDLFSMGDQSGLSAQEADLSEPFDGTRNLNAQDSGELNWAREDIPVTTTERPANDVQYSEYEDDSEADDL